MAGISLSSLLCSTALTAYEWPSLTLVKNREWTHPNERGPTACSYMDGPERLLKKLPTVLLGHCALL